MLEDGVFQSTQDLNLLAEHLRLFGKILRGVMINALFIGASPQTAEVANRIRERWPEAKSLVADGGADGLKLAEQSSPDLVFIYSDLPDMSLAKAIWELRHISDVLVVVLSHHEDEKDKVRQLNLGADHYVMLPCDLTELMAQISCLLRRAGSPVEQEERMPVLTSSPTVNPATHEVLMGDRWVALTPTHFKLLNRLLSKKAIQESLDNQASAAQALYGQAVAEINGRPFEESAEPQEEMEEMLPVEPPEEIEDPLEGVPQEIRRTASEWALPL